MRSLEQQHAASVKDPAGRREGRAPRGLVHTPGRACCRASRVRADSLCTNEGALPYLLPTLPDQLACPRLDRSRGQRDWRDRSAERARSRSIAGDINRAFRHSRLLAVFMVVGPQILHNTVIRDWRYSYYRKFIHVQSFTRTDRDPTDANKPCGREHTTADATEPGSQHK